MEEKKEELERKTGMGKRRDGMGEVEEEMV